MFSTAYVTGSGSPGPLDKKMPSGSISRSCSAGVSAGKNSYIAAAVNEVAQDVVFDAKVVSRHAVFGFLLKMSGLAGFEIAKALGPVIGFCAGDVLHEVAADQAGEIARFLNEAVGIEIDG